MYTVHDIWNYSTDNNMVRLQQDLNLVLHKHWKQFAPISRVWQITFGVLTLVIGLVAFIGNFLVISLFIRYRTFRNSANIFVLNLAISDMTLVITNFPLLTISSFYGYWIAGSVGCIIYGFFGSLSSFLSVNTLTAIALERYFVIVFQRPWYKKTSSSKICLSVCFVWIFSFAWSLFPFFGWGHYILEGSLTSCTFDFFTRTITNYSFVISILIFCFFLQVLFIFISYLGIFIKVAKHERELKDMSETNNGSLFYLRISKYRKSEKCEIKTAKVAFCIIVIFCLSWFPYAIVCMIGMFGHAEVIFPAASAIPGLCAKSVTVINPFVYALLHPKFRCKLRRWYFNKAPNRQFTQECSRNPRRALVSSAKGTEFCDSSDDASLREFQRSSINNGSMRSAKATFV